MFNFLTKLIFYLKKPQVIIVTGKGRACGTEATWQILKKHFKVKKLEEKIPNILSIFQKEIFLIETGLKKSSFVNKLKFLVKSSKLPILVVTHVGEIPFDSDFFSGARKETIEIRKLAEIIPSFGYLILNFDDEVVREIDDITNLNTLTFGFQKGADFQATDIRTNTGTNFKINYAPKDISRPGSYALRDISCGVIIPIWLGRLFGKEQIYSALTANCVGVAAGLNFVEISETLKDYKSLPGRMSMIEGIKKSWILDDSATSSIFSMIEALEILGKTEQGERKIAVLGDVLEAGKYTIEAHEVIGEKVAKSSNLLFTVGTRAKFIAQGAVRKGMPSEKIFQFDEIDSVIPALKKEIKKRDLILVDGSKEMEMKKIVKEIKI